MKRGAVRTCGVMAMAFAAAFLGACESSGSRGTIPGGRHLPGVAYLPGGVNDPAPVIPAPRPARETPAATPAPRPAAPVATGSAVMYYPSGERNSSQIMLEQVMPREVVRGAEYAYEYRVTNLTGGVLQNVVVNQLSTQNIDPRSSNPQGAATGGGVMWALGDLGPGETRTIRINAVSSATGTAGNCVTVSFNNSLCATTNVVEPALRLVKEATAAATTCDPIVMKFTVSNPGTGAATGVVIRDTLPEGLALEGGGRNIELAVGDLAAGATATREVRVRATGTGSFNNVATATAAGGLTAESNRTTTVVTKPALTITANCSQTQFLGRNICFEYTVRNTGTAPAANTVVTASIPAGTTFVEASTGGTASGSTVTFNVGTLAPNGTATVRYCVRTTSIGTVQSTASVNAGCADAATANCSTEMRGIPALLLETVDNPDPVEVGTQTTYTVTVTNQGSAVGTNIRIVCTLPAQQAFVSAGGATTATNSGQTVTFAPLASLAPGAKATWTVVIRASDTGDVRFTTVMTADQLSSPVQETESTNLYR